MKLATPILLAVMLSQVEARASVTVDLRDYAGNYRLTADHVLAIAEWEVDPSAPHLLAFTDLGSGRIGVLTEVGKDEFALAAALMSGVEAARLHFVRVNGRITMLTFTETGKEPRRAVRIPDRTEEITFSSDRADKPELHGTLWLPPGKGPFPAIALVPAGALGRTAPATFTNFFLSQGFAVLAYDRRPGHASFETLAGDAAAAVDALRRRSDVDPRLVGLWGHSQGGWLALVAAAASSHVAFVIDHSGMLVPAWQQESYRIAAEAADGIDSEVIQDAVRFTARVMRAALPAPG